MQALGRGMSTGRTWFLTVRLLEVASVALLAGSVYDAWLFSVAYSRDAAANGAVSEATQPSLAERVATFALYGAGWTTVRLLTVALLVLGMVAVLHLARQVSNAGLLRWETAVLGALAALSDLLLLTATAVGLVRGDPADPTTGEVVTYEQGPTLVEQLLATVATPAATALLLAAAALWWLRLSPELGDEGEEQAGVATGSEAPGALADGGPPARAAPPPAPMPSPAASPQEDVIMLDGVRVEGVEQIEPVERLHPRSATGDDGSTSNGYEDYLRRL